MGNNWHKEGYIKARLDSFLGSLQWLMKNDRAVVKHIENYSSYHSMLLLDTKPDLQKQKRRFYFDERRIGKPGVKKVIRDAWESKCIGSPMFKVASKIKRCKMKLIKWNRQQESKSAIRINNIKKELDELKDKKG